MWYNQAMSQRKPYPSDLTPQQWAILEPILRKALYQRKRKHRGAPRRYSLYDIVCAILYVLTTGCAWAQLPHDLPPWKTVYYHFRRWQQLGIWSQVAQALNRLDRRQAKRGDPQQVAIDSQSVPTTQKGGRAGMTQARKSRGVSGT